jgi:hypothetical protein
MIVLKMPNGRCFLPIPRSGSHCVGRAAIKSFHPGIEINEETHPIASYPDREKYDGSQKEVAVLVRNPIERFRSTIAHLKLPFDSQIVKPAYGFIPRGDFHYFKFETQLQACADWLGITAELVPESESPEKPELSEYQEGLMRGIYKKDIELWESLGDA